jgi:hypothetical protein
MTTDRAFRKIFFLAAAALIATSIGAKPLYAVEGDAADAKKVEQQKKMAKEKEKKPRETAAPTTNQYPGDNRTPGMGY